MGDPPARFKPTVLSKQAFKIKGLPLDRGGAQILDGLSESKQKEKEVKSAVFLFMAVLCQS